MTDKEIEVRLKALPYKVPPDITPGHLSVMMATMALAGAEGEKAEEKFWEHLHTLGPREQGEFFATARSSRVASKQLAWGVFSLLFLILLFWVLG